MAMGIRTTGRSSCAVLAILFCVAHWARAHETSDVYLQSVVNELNMVNGIQQQQLQLQQEQPQDSFVSASEDRRESFLEPPPNIELHQPQVVQKKPQQQQQLLNEVSPALRFSPSELAAIYTRALEQGTSLKYAPFVNTLNNQMPNIVTDTRYPPTESLQPLPPTDPQYAYYFYPLQSFHHELAANRPGYRILPHPHFVLPSKSSKKEMNPMNPILVGITSFMGMALFFFLSLFVYPRFMHLMHFPFFSSSRTIFQNELTHLTAFVTEAIDYYNRNIRKKSKRSSFIKPVR